MKDTTRHFKSRLKVERWRLLSPFPALSVAFHFLQFDFFSGRAGIIPAETKQNGKIHHVYKKIKIAFKLFRARGGSTPDGAHVL